MKTLGEAGSPNDYYPEMTGVLVTHLVADFQVGTTWAARITTAGMKSTR